jgi:hypothetical protein
MRRSKAWIGSLLIGAALAAAPAARADQTKPTPSGDSGVCMEDPGVSMQRAAVIDQISKQLAAQEVAESNGDVVSLNTSGYRYGADQGPRIARDLQILEVEVRRARAAAKSEGRLQ